MKKLMILLLFFTLSCSDKDVDVEGVEAPSLSSSLGNLSSITSAIKLEVEANPSYWFGGTLTELSYENWTAADKSALNESFQRAWQRLYQSEDASLTSTDEFSMPLKCDYCEDRLVSNPTNGPFTVLPEAISKKAYIAYVAHSLAVEIGGATSWTVAADSNSELHHFFNSRSMMHRTGTSSEFFLGEPGGGGDARIKYIGRVSPATPYYVYRWFKDNQLLKSTKQETIYAVLDWFRGNGVHFYGSATYATMDEHWGYPAQPSVYHVLKGTVRDTESTPQHWTAGCHGTAGVIKSALKAVNIPAEVIYTCGHAQLYFPSIDMYLDHGDNPYNSNVSSQASKSISGILISPATYTTRFSASPDYLNPADPLCANIGRAATEF